MALAFVQDTSGAIADGGTLAYGSNVGSGTLLAALIMIPSGTLSVNGITDSLGNTWALGVKSGVDNTRIIEIWYAACPTGGANTVTFDWTGAVNGQVVLAEFSGFPNGVTKDQTNSLADSAAGTNHSCGDITTTVAEEVVLASHGFDSGFSVSSRETNYVALETNVRQDSHYLLTSGTLTTDGDITTADIERGPSAIASFYATAGGGGDTILPMMNALYYHG